MKSEDIVKIENLNKKEFMIKWHLTYICNYKCDFCIQGNQDRHNKKSLEESVELRKRICDNLIKFIENELDGKFREIFVYLIGGEVSILPDFTYIIEKLVNCRFKGKIIIRITTNLSADINVFKKIINLVEDKRLYDRELRIKASFYKEFADEEEFVEKIKLLNSNNHKIRFKNLKRLKSNIKNVYRNKFIKKIEEKKANDLKERKGIVNANVGYPLCCDEDYKEYLIFKKKYKKIVPNISFIIIKGYKTSISENLKRRIEKEDKDLNIKVTFKNGETYYCRNNNKIILKLDNEEEFKSKGYLCDIGMTSITINNKGVVSRCSSSKKETIIGNIEFEEIKLPTQKMICVAEHCSCSFYGVIEKQK